MKITTTIHPNSKKPQVVKNKAGKLDIYVNKPAIDNKANEAAIKLLAKHLEIRQSEIILIKGQKSKEKLFQVLNKVV